MDDLMELPAAQASKASFPPGCCVWIHSTDTDNYLAHGNHYAVQEGKVESIYLADVFSASRKLYYKVEDVVGCGTGTGTEFVSETNMTFSNNTPIFFFDCCVGETNGDSSVDSETAQKGNILTSMWSADNSGKAHAIYSVRVSTERKLMIKHGVRPGQLRFRPEGLTMTISTGEVCLTNVDQRTLLTDLKPKPPPPGFATRGNSADRSFAVVAATNKHNPESASLKQNKLQIPRWLVTNDSSRNEVVDTLTSSIPIIFETTGCKILIQENELEASGCVWVTLTEHAEQDKGMKKAIEMVENSLVAMLGGDEARGRLLYDMAVSYSDMKPDGAVQQRNPLNSSERVWMYVVDLPAEIHEGIMSFIASPFVDGKTYDSLHEANCTLKLCRDSFGVKMTRCRPYVLVYGKQAMDVSHAIVITKNCLKAFMQKKMTKTGQTLVQKSTPPSRWGHSLSSSATSKKLVPKPRIVTIPQWLMLDASFRQQVEGGLFGIDWCQQMEMGEKTGCVILLSQNHLIVTPTQTGRNEPSITKAIDLIEDVLVGVLGAQESKCKLIYDLTESYSQVLLDGVIQMRNPLNSSERIWASIVTLPRFANKEGNHKYLFQPFLSKYTEIQLHKLKCTVKVCNDNFNMKLQHCEPHVMIFGRQKNNVGKAFEFIKKAVKKCRREMESRN